MSNGQQTPPGDPRPSYEQPRVMAPTLAQFWRSDVRRPPGQRAPRWAGWISLGVGVLALLALLAGGVLGVPQLVAASLPLSWTAGFFGLVALIAGIGRLAGLVGLLLALGGNVVLLDWLGRLFA